MPWGVRRVIKKRQHLFVPEEVIFLAFGPVSGVSAVIQLFLITLICVERILRN
jgi:hypothetical protein